MDIIDWLAQHNGQLNVAMNITTAFGMATLVAVVLYGFLKINFASKSGLRWIMIGAIIEGLGWCFNRSWWAFSWYAETHGWSEWNVVGSNLAWVSLIGLFMSLVGLVMILSPMLMPPDGTKFWKPTVIIMTLYMTMFLLTFNFLV